MIHSDAWGKSLHYGQLVSAPNVGHVRVWALGRARNGRSVVLADFEGRIVRFLAHEVVAVRTVPR
jgi:hypothetical protein